jgi:hypothetical protein
MAKCTPPRLLNADYKINVTEPFSTGGSVEWPTALYEHAAFKTVNFTDFPKDLG